MSSRVRVRLSVLAVALVVALASCGRRQADRQPTGRERAAETSVQDTGLASMKGLVCFECHTPITETEDRGIRFSHAKHRDRGAHCNMCHGKYDHNPLPPDAEPHEYGIGGACLDCHDGEQASDDCMLCHLDRRILMPDSHHQEGFIRDHGPVDDPNTDCHLCHAASWCLNCHQVPVPHPDGFFARHGSEFMQNPKVCYQCHEPDGCHDCHGVPMPHTETFLDHHGRHDLSTCDKCHTSSFCHNCHTNRNPHPQNFVQTHGDDAGRHPEGCSVCHQRSWCMGCHGVPLPHPRNYVQVHGPIALRSEDVCYRCHQRSMCSNCHGMPMPHPPGFMDVHGKRARESQVTCMQCHTESECRQCHGTEVPHPSDYIVTGHKGEASYSPDSFCFKCHDREFCNLCHVTGAEPEAGTPLSSRPDNGANAVKPGRISKVAAE